MLPPGEEQEAWVRAFLATPASDPVPLLSLEHNIDPMSRGQTHEEIAAACVREERTTRSRESSVDSIKQEPKTPEKVDGSVEQSGEDQKEVVGSDITNTEDQEKAGGSGGTVNEESEKLRPESEVDLDPPPGDTAAVGVVSAVEEEELLKERGSEGQDEDGAAQLLRFEPLKDSEAEAAEPQLLGYKPLTP